jgi:hypothetical protein
MSNFDITFCSMSAMVSEIWLKESIAASGEDGSTIAGVRECGEPIAGDGEDGVSGLFPFFLMGVFVDEDNRNIL